MTELQIKEIIEKRLMANGERIEETFSFGIFRNEPNAKGIFCKENVWFLYSIDDKKAYSIKGPFSEQEIIYAISIYLHKSKYFDDYKFGSEAMKVYIHSHYKSVAEAIGGLHMKIYIEIDEHALPHINTTLIGLGMPTVSQCDINTEFLRSEIEAYIEMNPENIQEAYEKQIDALPSLTYDEFITYGYNDRFAILPTGDHVDSLVDFIFSQKNQKERMLTFFNQTTP